MVAGDEFGHCGVILAYDAWVRRFGLNHHWLVLLWLACWLGVSLNVVRVQAGGLRVVAVRILAVVEVLFAVSHLASLCRVAAGVLLPFVAYDPPDYFLWLGV